MGCRATNLSCGFSSTRFLGMPAHRPSQHGSRCGKEVLQGQPTRRAAWAAEQQTSAAASAAPGSWGCLPTGQPSIARGVMSRYFGAGPIRGPHGLLEHPAQHQVFWGCLHTCPPSMA